MFTSLTRRGATPAALRGNLRVIQSAHHSALFFRAHSESGACFRIRVRARGERALKFFVRLVAFPGRAPPGLAYTIEPDDIGRWRMHGGHLEAGRPVSATCVKEHRHGKGPSGPGVEEEYLQVTYSRATNYHAGVHNICTPPCSVAYRLGEKCLLGSVFFLVGSMDQNWI